MITIVSLRSKGNRITMCDVLQIRTAVLRMLQQLPIEVADGLRKEQLKKSELGKVVMFLYRLPDESQANRRIAKVSCLRNIAR